MSFQEIFITTPPPLNLRGSEVHCMKLNGNFQRDGDPHPQKISQGGEEAL